MAMRLIDADAIVYTHEVARCLEDGHNWIELCVTQDDIECMPTIDAVEVVRCEYCKYYVGEMFFDREVFWCNRKYKQGSGMMELTDADGFCSYGKRRTGGRDQAD